jgi:hypothetical protein
MNSSDDEYEGYNLAEFSQEDFANIDADILVRGLVNLNDAPKGGPAVTIEIHRLDEDLAGEESQGQASSSTPFQHTVPDRDVKQSPFERHRSWNKVLSVSDLVSPAWCALYFTSMGITYGPFMKV